MFPKTSIRKKRSTPRPGRLQGEDLEALRVQVYVRDGGRCKECGILCSDNFPDWHPRKFEMAHIRGKRMHGDSLDNVRTLCKACHTKEHAYGKSLLKPCPPKEKVA